MKILFIGGTGNISTACTREALRQGHTVYHLNRGLKAAPGKGVLSLKADIRKPAEAAKAIDGLTFDAVADFIAFVPEHVEADLKIFAGRTGQFLFISSASVYHKPARHHVITESTPAFNPFWKYSENKIACENLLRRKYEERRFPMTIVRPSHTYSEAYIPTPFGVGFTESQRILDGREIVLHGDGQSLWTLTHSDDFAKAFTGLLGNPRAYGETFHITGDEVLSWENITNLIGDALGKAPRIVHVPSDIIARLEPELGAGLLGDKTYCAIFDNTKIKQAVPGFQATIPFHVGVRRSVEWFMADPRRRAVDPALDKALDHILSDWKK
ncbi:MAG: SDR family oxidoreductase [Spirochaetales bacterium]|nr:SDR family oxidoreductase [Spirochaetales bacterium]